MANGSGANDSSTDFFGQSKHHHSHRLPLDNHQRVAAVEIV
jgi:hypothetical protein